jgi:hydrogenase-4 component E
MSILFIITGLFIIGLKKSSLLPFILFCQAFVITIISYRSGLTVPLAVLVFTLKAVIIPLLFYYIVRKTIAIDKDESVVPVLLILFLVLALSVAAYFITLQLNEGPFTMAAIFTAFVGILLITSRNTLVSQLTGFIVLQNGIFAFTSSLHLKFTFAIEFLLAIDVFFSVFIIVYAIQTIYKSTGSININTFNSLRG